MDIDLNCVFPLIFYIRFYREIMPFPFSIRANCQDILKLNDVPAVKKYLQIIMRNIVPLDPPVY